MNRCQHHNYSPGQPNLADRLRADDRKITGPRRAILDLLEAEPHPLTIRHIHRALKSRRCDLATVYRAMHLLERLGLVKRFDFGDGSARFELIRRGGPAHHHHLICTGCSCVVEIEDCFPAKLEAKIASGHGFTSITHKLEFFGLCPQCQP